jgi:hypothetical protein
MTADIGFNSKQEHALNSFFDDKETSFIEKIINGTVPQMIANNYGLGRINEVLNFCSSITEEDGIKQILEKQELIRSSISELIDISEYFDHYPFVSTTARKMSDMLRYADLGAQAILSEEINEKIDRKVSTYIIKNHDTGMVKIGKTNSMEKRISALQVGAGSRLDVLAIIEMDIEKDLHTRFEKFHYHGEWFQDYGGVISNFANNYIKMADDALGKDS